MKIGVVVDSACDLPREFLSENRLTVLPVTLKIGAHALTDNRDPAVMQMFYREHYAQRGQDAETAPASVEQIRDLFLSRLVLEYDQVFALLIAGSRSPMHAHARQAAVGIVNSAPQVRKNSGVPGSFGLQVIDTQNLFAGQGVTAVEAVRLIKSSENPRIIGQRLEALAQTTYGYMLPRDLYFLRARAHKKGDRSVGWLTALLGAALGYKPVLRAHRGETRPVARIRGFEEGVRKLFDFAGKRVRAGLLAPVLCVSYGGELQELEALPGYAALQQVCRESRVELFASVMSMTGAINVGEGAVTLGFAAGPHDFSS